jgi:hypothetical protein
MKRLRPGQLVDRLAGYMERASGKRLEAEGRERLSAEIRLLGDYYDRLVSEKIASPPPHLYGIEPDLTHVIEILGNKENLLAVLSALGKSGSRPKTMIDLLFTLRTLLSDLRHIQNAVSPAPKKRSRGRPAYAEPLTASVDALAIIWKRETGQPIKQYWHKAEPLTPAAQFVNDAVEYIAPGQSVSVSKVMAKVIKKHRGTTFQK